MALVTNEAKKVDMSAFFEAVKKAECVQAYKDAGTFQVTNEALKVDMSTIFAAIKQAECVQAYKDAGTFQVTNEALKPMQGKIWKVRG